MNLKQIIENVNIDEVTSKMIELYPCQANNVEGYVGVVKQLKDMSPLKNSSDIKIVVFECEDEFSKDDIVKKHIEVLGFSEKEDKKYALEWTSWGKWLALEIYENCLKKFSEEEVLVHCLYEMTFCGFSEEEIDADIKEIEDRRKEVVDKIKHKNTVKMLTFSDICKELGIEEFYSSKVDEKTEQRMTEIRERNQREFNYMIGRAN